MTGFEIAAVVGAVVAAGTGIYQGVEAKNTADAAASDAERIAQENALASNVENTEEERRLRVSNAEQQAKIKASIAASGTEGGGSQEIYRTGEQMKFEEDIAWMQRATDSRNAINIQQAGYEADNLRRGGEAALWGSVGSAVSTIGAQAPNLAKGYNKLTGHRRRG